MATQLTDHRLLGGSKIVVPALGVGTWSWGDKGYWGFGTGYTSEDIAQAYSTSLDLGLNFFDTAEIYGRGNSERLIQENHQRDPRPILIATKFAPLPNRFSAHALHGALNNSLSRLGVQQVDLYQIHWPYTWLSINGLMDAMAEAVRAGKVRAVGVSNYSADQMKRAHERLAKYQIPLASNQVHYSLLHRSPERNGVLAACRDLDVALIAYTPLEQGLLTGKYRAGRTIPQGEQMKITRFRRTQTSYDEKRLQAIEPLLQAMEEVSTAHGKSLAQVALNWLLKTDPLVIPIPGAKNIRQARDNAGAVGWTMSDAEYQRLSDLAK